MTAAVLQEKDPRTGDIPFLYNRYNNSIRIICIKGIWVGRRGSIWGI